LLYFFFEAYASKKDFEFPQSEDELCGENKKEQQHNEESLSFVKKLMLFIDKGENQTLIKEDCFLANEINRSLDLGGYNMSDEENKIGFEILYNLDFNTKSFYTSYINSLKEQNVSNENCINKVTNMLNNESYSSIYKVNQLGNQISQVLHDSLVKRITSIKDLLVKSYSCIINKS